MSDNPKHKKNGGPGTGFGNFLRNFVSAGKKIAPELLEAGLKLTNLDGVGKIIGLIDNDPHLSAEDKELLKMQLELERVEMEEVTKRWESDAKSESWLPRNVRPIMLIYLAIVVTVLAILDSSETNAFQVNDKFVELFGDLLSIAFVAYFGSRGVEKLRKITKGRL